MEHPSDAIIYEPTALEIADGDDDILHSIEPEYPRQSWCSQEHSNPLNACPILCGIEVRPSRYAEVGPKIARQLRSAMSLMADPASGLTIPHDWMCLRALTLLWTHTPDNSGIELGELEHILKHCPELKIVRCRLMGEEAQEADESRLDRAFAPAKHLKEVHLDTCGPILPYLKVLRQFEEATLVCSPRLSLLDVEYLRKVDGPDRDRSALRHFTFGAHPLLKIVSQETSHRGSCPTTAALIQRMLPRRCIVNFTIAHYGSADPIKGSEILWWEWYCSEVRSLIKAASISTGVRDYVPMTAGQLAEAMKQK